jgi:murein L,D-transpeptidase YcbB/YkuD
MMFRGVGQAVYPDSKRRSGHVRRRAALALFATAAMCFAAPSFAQAQAQHQAPAGEIEAAVRSAARGDREVTQFYRARAYRPLWVREGVLGAEGRQLLHLIETAEADGLDPRAYRPEALEQAIEAAAGGSPRALARAEWLLSNILADYVRDVRQHRDMGVVYTEQHLRPVVPTKTAVLNMAAGAPSLQTWLESVGWMNPIYTQLRGALAAQRGVDSHRPQVHVPSGPILRPGSSDPRVRLLRERLGMVPDGPYDRALQNAVREVQAAHGLPRDGLAGPLTLAILNRGSLEQHQLLRLNLERARALPSQLGRRYVLVDAAAARLWMYEDGRAVDSMRVVVGKPSEPTPMMAATIRYLTLNPYWNIPQDLVRRRVAEGALREGPSFLAGRRYEIMSDWTDDAVRVDPATVDWRGVAAGRQELRVRQLPGPDNAMGRMKFMFPNELGVYLHDTPERSLLREEGRLFSSGCVRLEDAPRLARWLFGQAPRASGSAPEQRVDLPEPVPVYLTYMTAAPEPDGVALRPDVYNRDPVQLAALEAPAPRQRRKR